MAQIAIKSRVDGYDIVNEATGKVVNHVNTKKEAEAIVSAKKSGGSPSNRKKLEHEGSLLEEWAYLLHHVHVDEKTGKEVLHHCFLLDHLGNEYEQKHIVGKDGRNYHTVAGLIPEQKEVYYSDEEARDDGQQVPCANRQLEKPR